MNDKLAAKEAAEALAAKKLEESKKSTIDTSRSKLEPIGSPTRTKAKPVYMYRKVFSC